MEGPQYNTRATHIIHPGARILVQTLGSKAFAFATVNTQFPAALQPEELEPHHESSMDFFLAMIAFSVWYPRHNKSYWYKKNTHIYAFHDPEDGKVTIISPLQERKEEKWKQGSFSL